MGFDNFRTSYKFTFAGVVGFVQKNAVILRRRKEIKMNEHNMFSQHIDIKCPELISGQKCQYSG